ncbi:MAG: NUDIX hydrolase [Propionicimonas sp.]
MGNQERPLKQITAAGTVVLRPGKSVTEPEILLVHRPSYNDWSLPKGKLSADEYLPGCAVRETLEETAAMVRLAAPLDRIRYPVGGGIKTVSYWRASLTSAGRHKPNSEIDRILWLPASKAIEQVSYPDEVPLIHQAIELPDTTPFLIVRHGKAMLRANWSGRDQARPLDSRGRRQSELLVPLLDAYGVERVVSSSSTRCVQTLNPFVKTRQRELETSSTLSEEQGMDNPKAVETLMQRLLQQTVERRAPIAVCGHRPILPVMLRALGIPPRSLLPGTAVLAHLDSHGTTVSVELHRPRI